MLLIKLLLQPILQDEDFNSTQGFDKLIKRVKDGRSAVKDVESFIKERFVLSESLLLLKMFIAKCKTYDWCKVFIH